ncbi:MAG: MerR family DNA-binding protein [Planctomycetes bacterium]|nr:MerR family DNA-binding protein [Planctomycetota bacterium]
MLDRQRRGLNAIATLGCQNVHTNQAVITRTGGGHRAYGEDYLKRFNFIRHSCELGFSLDSVRQILRLVDGGDVTCIQVHEMTLEHLKDVQIKIADLKRMERTLKDTVARCTGKNTPDCPIIDALYAS